VNRLESRIMLTSVAKLYSSVRRLMSNLPTHVILNDIQLNFLNRALFLGITLDCNLSLSDHITNIAAEVSKSVGIM